jgi:hypothetical protein
MEIGLTRGHERHEWSLPTWLLAALFWAFTYSLFAYRAHLRYGDEYLLFSPQRLVGTLVGAGLFWLVMSSLIRVGGTKPAKPIAVIATILPASIVVLAARLLLAEFVDGQVTELQMNMRWVLVWSGYFGLWISAALALHTARLAKASSAAQPIGPIAQPRSVGEPSAASLEWVVDEIAAAMAVMPARQRSQMLDRLERKAGYEMADAIGPLASEHNARVRLVRELVIRCGKRS